MRDANVWKNQRRLSVVISLWVVLFFFFFCRVYFENKFVYRRLILLTFANNYLVSVCKVSHSKKPNCRTNVNNSHSQQVDYVQQCDCCVQPVSYRGPCRPLRWKRLGSQTTRSLRHCKIITLKVILCRTNCMVSCKQVTFVSRVLSFVTQY